MENEECGLSGEGCRLATDCETVAAIVAKVALGDLVEKGGRVVGGVKHGIQVADECLILPELEGIEASGGEFIGYSVQIAGEEVERKNSVDRPLPGERT